MSDSPYLVSARKYRPLVWDTVVGQSGITKTLQQAISSNQIAQAYLFCGPRGVGKTTCARIFSRAINGFAPDDDAMAFNVFELDAASNNKVEDIRSIVEQVRIPPQHGTYKVYIIDEVHMLSQAAFNAFLKTLEEPPPHAVFILATTEKHKILPTILSRCQIFDFHRISVPDMVLQLQEIAEKEGVETSAEALHVIAAKADGALRDALSMFDQLVAFAGKNLTYNIVTEQLHVLDHDTYFEIVDYALEMNISDSLLLFDGVLCRGFDSHHFLSGLGNHFRNLMVCRDSSTLKLMEATDEVKARYSQQASKADLHFLIDALSVTNEADVQYRTSQNQRLLVELSIMKICSIRSIDKKKRIDLIIPFSEEGKTATPELAVSNLTKKEAPVEASGQVKVDEVKELSKESVNETKFIKSKLRKGSFKLAGKSKTLAEVRDSSVNALVNKVDESWKSEVTSEGVKAAWDEFVEKHRKADRVSLVSSLVMCKVELIDNIVSFEVKNSLQQVQIDSERTELLHHLRKTLKNANLELSISIAKSEKGADDLKVFLTDKDRYLKMAEKNPELNELRKRLDLDLG